MGAILTMVGYDLRQRLRDRSVFVFAILVPFGMIFVFNLVFGGMTSVELKPVTVAVSAPEGDQLAGVVPGALEGASGPDLPITVERVADDEVAGLVEDGTAAVGVQVPDGFMTDLLAGEAPDVLVTVGDESGIETSIVTSIVDGTLAQLSAGAQTSAAALAAGVPPTELAAIGQAAGSAGPSIGWSQGRTADEQLTPQAGLVAGQAGMFLLFTVGFGVLGLIVEREWGTLARVLSSPVRGWQVLLSKAVVSFILGVVATTVLLVAGTFLFDGVDFGSPVAVGVLVALVVTAATSIMFVIAKVARTAEQANIAQAILAIVLGMTGGAFFRVPTTGLLGDLMQINPISAFTRGLGVTSGGGGVADLGPTALVLTAFTAVCLLATWLMPGKKDVL